jgi:hypothetical protein
VTSAAVHRLQLRTDFLQLVTNTDGPKRSRVALPKESETAKNLRERSKTRATMRAHELQRTARKRQSKKLQAHFPNAGSRREVLGAVNGVAKKKRCWKSAREQGTPVNFVSVADKGVRGAGRRAEAVSPLFSRENSSGRGRSPGVLVSVADKGFRLN